MIATSPEIETFKFWIPGKVVPKARPRFNCGQAYLPAAYRGWKNAAYLEVLSQISDFPTTLPLHRASVQIQLVGKHRGDLDNVAGSVLDTLVSSGVLLDDRLSCVSRLVIEHEPSGDRGVWVEVKPLS